MLTKERIHLSDPHMTGLEQNFITEAFETNWIAPLGSNVDGFERDVETFIGGKHHVVALSSGTASIHIALDLLGVTKGDEVLCQSFTFSASANPIIYLGATPIFIDSEPETWNMSPELLEIAIKDRIEKNKVPKAIVVVSLYGMPHKAHEINRIAKKYDIPVVEDSAESFGSKYYDNHCGTLSDIGVFSFNGNKIITTSGGGTLITNSIALKEKAIFLSTQARDDAPHYEHSTVGYNYRMSNILAGIGRGQMKVINDRVTARRNIYNFYKKNLSKFDSISFLEEPTGCFSNRWITCIKTKSFEQREAIRLALLEDNIESKPLWKPMHMQPVFKDCLSFSNGVSENLFDIGLCLPSGSNLSQNDLNRIINVIANTPKL